MNHEQVELNANLHYIADRLKGKCTTVITNFQNGNVSFGAYNNSIHHIWEFGYYDNVLELKDKLNNLKGTFGL